MAKDMEKMDDQMEKEGPLPRKGKRFGKKSSKRGKAKRGKGMRY